MARSAAVQVRPQVFAAPPSVRVAIVVEIGIRLALGAPAGSVRTLILRDGTILAVSGTVIGVAAIGTRRLGSLLYRTSATDPSIFAGAAVLIGSVAFAASWIPGRRAEAADPLEVFRHG